MQIIPVEEIPKAEDVPLDNLMKIYKVCLDMEKVCKEGVGISAVQVGIPWKLFLVRYYDHFEYYINCEYEPLVDVNQKHFQSIEGCLSLRNKDGSFRQFLVERFPKIKVKGKRLRVNNDLTLEDIDINFENDKYAIILQHEIDHFLGVEGLISNIGKEIEITNVK
jgi:peptide deformylase